MYMCECVCIYIRVCVYECTLEKVYLSARLQVYCHGAVYYKAISEVEGRRGRTTLRGNRTMVRYRIRNCM